MTKDNSIIVLDSIETLVLKISKPRNKYIQSKLGEWLDKSEYYTKRMMSKPIFNDEELYWYFKTLYMYNKICPNLKHDLPKPETMEECLAYNYENSQARGLAYDEYSYRMLENYYIQNKNKVVISC